MVYVTGVTFNTITFGLGKFHTILLCMSVEVLKVSQLLVGCKFHYSSFFFFAFHYIAYTLIARVMLHLNIGVY